MSSPAGAMEAAAGSQAAQERAAVAAGALCYLFWGFLPLLFKAAAWAGAGPWEIVAWRTGNGLASVLPLGDRIVFAVVFAAALAIGIRFALPSRREAASFD